MCCHGLIACCVCRVLRFVGAYEKGGPPKPAAGAEVKLTQEQIRECGKQFGIELEDQHDYESMQRTMTRDRFRDWINACGYLQIMQNAIAKGNYEDRTEGLWKQAIIRRYTAIVFTLGIRTAL